MRRLLLVLPLVTATTLRFTFTRIRGVDTAVALGRLQLIDQFGTELTPTSYTAKPSGGWNGAEKLFDGTTATQWRDGTFAASAGTDGLSELTVTYAGTHDFLSYEFWAFNKKKERDPLAWTVAVQNVCGEFTQVSSEDEGTLDPGRGQSYTPGGSFALVVGSAAAAGSCDPLPPSLPPPSLPPAPPSLPPAPPSLPHGDAYSFVFTGVRGPNADGIALSEIGLFDAAGATIAVVDATNPGGDNYGNSPSKLVDGNTDGKWYDYEFSVSGQSVVVLSLATPAVVASYQMTSAKDVPKRDPTDWRFGIQRADGSFEVLSVVTAADPPDAGGPNGDGRNAIYQTGGFVIGAAPPPSASPSPPPPSASPSPPPSASPSPPPPALPPSPSPHAPAMSNKKGILSAPYMTAAHYLPFDGKVSVLYNYNVHLLHDAEVDFLNRNGVEFVPMVGGAYLETQRETAPTGWPLASGVDQRCYHYASAVPANGGSLCTLQDFIDILDATDSLLTRKVTRFMLYNEPWPQAEHPEPVIDAVAAYKAYFQPVAEQRNLDLISWTTQNGAAKGLAYDAAFLRLCIDDGCDIELIKFWQIHRYSTKQQYWERNYAPFTGDFWAERVTNFTDGYGGMSGADWEDYFTGRKLFISEFSAEQEDDPPDNVGTCLRYAGQYGDAATCADPACNWGAGLLAWMLDSDQSVVDTVIPWPTLIGAASENQVGGKASQLTYDDGELTPAGRAFLAMPDDGASVDCGRAPPPLPPSPSQPPSTPPAPPRAPLSCADVAGLTNTLTLGSGKFCTELNQQIDGGCGAYFSKTASGKTRLCSNPNGDTVVAGEKCAQSVNFVVCTADPPPSASPSPPPPSTSPSPPPPSASPSPPPPSTSPSPPPSASPSPPPSASPSPPPPSASPSPPPSASPSPPPSVSPSPPPPSALPSPPPPSASPSPPPPSTSPSPPPSASPSPPPSTSPSPPPSASPSPPPSASPSPPPPSASPSPPPPSASPSPPPPLLPPAVPAGAPQVPPPPPTSPIPSPPPPSASPSPPPPSASPSPPPPSASPSPPPPSVSPSPPPSASPSPPPPSASPSPPPSASPSPPPPSASPSPPPPSASPSPPPPSASPRRRRRRHGPSRRYASPSLASAATTPRSPSVS